MLSLVLLKRPCSSLIFLIPWLEVPSSIAVKEIRDVISYLNLIANPADNISFERVINEPKRELDLVRLKRFALLPMSKTMSLLDASANIMLSPIKGKAAQAFTILLT